MRKDEQIEATTASFAAVMIRREMIERERKPDVKIKDYSVLKNGPRTYKAVVHWVIVNRHTGEFHHHAVTIESYRKSKDGWYMHPSQSVTFETTDTDELQALVTFILAVTGEDIPEFTNRFLAVPLQSNESTIDLIGPLLDAISDSSRVTLVADALRRVGGDASALRQLAQHASIVPEISRGLAAALNLASFTEALQELRRLIESNAREQLFQSHLERHPWMFGSEYSELLDRREWVRGQEQDFMLRRTVDGYLEIIEIKTTLDGAALFLHDKSHNSFYPRTELTAAIGQVMTYLEEIDAQRDLILRRDNEDLSKLKSRIIIGRDLSREQIAALHRFNAHLHRIEVMTFDQLHQTASRVLNYLAQVIESNPGI